MPGVGLQSDLPNWFWWMSPTLSCKGPQRGLKYPPWLGCPSATARDRDSSCSQSCLLWLLQSCSLAKGPGPWAM